MSSIREEQSDGLCGLHKVNVKKNANFEHEFVDYRFTVELVFVDDYFSSLISKKRTIR